MSHSWIYEEDPARLKPACHVCPHPKWKNGQWMMFFPNSLIDEKWDQAVDLYRRGKLTGVQSMKVICLLMVFECPSCLFTFLRKLYKQIFFQVSTFRENLNLNIKNRPCQFATIHVIIFYCGPSDHRDIMMEIGHNLLRYIAYENLHGAMFYSDSKSSGDITFKYRIILPNYCDCMMCVKA